MSNLLSTSAMVTECQSRVPIGLSTAYWMKKLNEAYRWVSQKGNFIWDVKAWLVNVDIGLTVFTIPPDCDPGKPMYLSGPYFNTGLTPTTMNSTIPYKQWDEAMDQQLSEMTVPAGAVSCWSFSTSFTAGPPPVYTYTGRLFPDSAKPTVSTGTLSYSFVYHMDVSGTEFAAASNVYFPTPNSFDTLFIELAEAEVRRIYGLAGWDFIQKRAESAIVNLLDSYRSTKNVLAGIVDQQKQLTEKKMMAQERG